jgi:tetratricopeptide (TPR) repeat protein
LLAESGRLIRERRDPRPTRAQLERALDLLEQARAAGNRHPHLDLWVGETLFDLRRFEEALPHLQVGVEKNKDNYWSWFRCALCLQAMERPRDALEYAVGALAVEPGSGGVRNLVTRLCRGLIRGGVDGLTAAAMLALTQATNEPHLLPPAAKIRPRDDPRDRDLAAYVLAQGGPVVPPTGDRPTAILVRARLGDEAARSALSSAAARDPLVLHLAKLDPELAPLVQ